MCGRLLIPRLVVLLSAIITSALSNEPVSSPRRRPQSQEKLEPVFDDRVAQHVSAQVGSTVRLNCRVYHLGDNTVSWIKKRDGYLLTFGDEVFTSDSRVHILHSDQLSTKADWTLQIKDPTKDDEGDYECQVSTNPKKSRTVRLRVVIAQVSLDGPPNVEVGGRLEIRCNVSGPSPPKYIDWFHENRLIEAPQYLRTRHGGEGAEIKVKEGAGWTQSILTRRAVTMKSGGTYTCKLSEIEQRSLTVNVHPRQSGGSTSHQLSLTSSAETVRRAHLLSCLTITSYLYFTLT